MPLYEYRCDDCGKLFEVRQKFSDKPLNTCRYCGGRAKKLISQAAFSLKGGGWYQQGYSSEKKSTVTTGNDACSGCSKAANG